MVSDMFLRGVSGPSEALGPWQGADLLSLNPGIHESLPCAWKLKSSPPTLAYDRAPLPGLAAKARLAAEETPKGQTHAQL